MELGNFSLSLTVKDLEKSRAFYQALGFDEMGGDASQGWLILKNAACILGLFQGMFDRNMLTFNPGWDESGTELPAFMDVRDIQKRLKAAGIVVDNEVDESSSGPASIMLTDPDGNPILIDQHV